MTTTKDRQWAELDQLAHAAGIAAGQAARPTPMTIVERVNPLDDSSPIKRQYAPVMDGICGTAYVKVRPGNSSFARWLKKHRSAFTAYYGGVQFSVNDFGQSYERAMAYATAYAATVREQHPEMKVYTDSWIN
jgi:hypothetical protein